MDPAEERRDTRDDGPRGSAGEAVGARVDLGEAAPGEPRAQSEPEPRTSSRQTQGAPASFWRRLGAYIVDAVLLAVASNVATTVVLGSPPDVNPLEPSALEVLWPYYAVNALIAWLYFASTESSDWQATLGKRLLGLEVTDEAGEKISFLRATGRYFGKVLSALPLGLGFLMIFATQDNQALHDKLASCLVLEPDGDDHSDVEEWPP